MFAKGVGRGTSVQSDNLSVNPTKSRSANTQKTLRLKTNSKRKYMDGNINRAKAKMLAERDLL